MNLCRLRWRVALYRFCGIVALALLVNNATGQTSLSTSSPLITEFMAVNKSTLPDADGAYSAWIELFNPGTRPVNLFNYSLTDTLTNLNQWRFPNYSLASGSYVVVFASGKDRAVVTNELHTNFRLPAASGFVALVDPATNIVSSFGPGYPGQEPDISYGRDPIQWDRVGFFSAPTPGNPNACVGPGAHGVSDRDRVRVNQRSIRRKAAVQGVVNDGAGIGGRELQLESVSKRAAALGKLDFRGESRHR